MAAVSVILDMDEGLKTNMERVCKEMGMNITTAFIIFAERVSKDRRIPFDVAADPDPFYSEANMARLQKAIANIEAGKMTAHDLIEIEDDE